MKYLLYCVVFTLVLVSCFGQATQDLEEGLRPLARNIRQAEPKPPEMPEPPEFPEMKMVNQIRERRAAKGVSGSLPTRKG
ncbi:unnamed protein product [Leptosia nina]|uniref:Uncharacterized protein n=1 Tax=Leptosia nina TaxID=320188 RepID=A0AAV1IYE7_9NEOP